MSDSTRPGWLVVLLAGAAIFAAPAAAAAAGPELSGSVSASWYHQGDGSDNGLEAHSAGSRMLERIRLNGRNLAPGVDFGSSFAVRHWFDADRKGSETRIHQAFVRVRGPGRWSGIRLLAGRHWRYGTGSTGLLDGVTLSWRDGPVRAEAFLGTRDWEARDEIRWPDFDRSKWGGFSFGARIAPWGEMAIGYNKLTRENIEDREIFAATGEWRPARGYRINGEYRYDTLRGYALDQRIRGTWRPDGRRELWAEVATRRPDLDDSWFLSNFGGLLDHDREEVRFGGRWALPRDVSVTTDVLVVDHGQASPAASSVGAGWDLREEDSYSWDTSTRLVWRGQMVGWYGGGGYGGERNGVILSLGRHVLPRVHAGFDANILAYQYGRYIRVDESVATTSVWVEAELDDETRVMARIERLDNVVDSNDYRFFVRLRRGFRMGG